MEIKAESVDLFLKALVTPECAENTEFSEWSGKKVFHLMQDTPELFFGKLREAGDEVAGAVHQALIKPAHDLFDYPAINNRIRSDIKDSDIKKFAISLFGPALDRHEEEKKAWEEKNAEKWEYEQR